MNMKNYGCRNVRKQREIKGSDKYLTLDSPLKFDNLDKMRITSSEPKYNYGRSGKGLIPSLDLKAKARPDKYKKARHVIKKVIKKDLSRIIREFEKLPYEIYERKKPKHEPTESYFYLSNHIAKCMMRADALNLKIYPVITEITAKKQISTLRVFSTDKRKLK